MKTPLIRLRAFSEKYEIVSIIFFIASTLLTLVGVPLYLSRYGLPLGLAIFSFLYYIGAGFGITAGYHRLFAHRTYEASSFVKFYYLFMGASTIEHSALTWATQHRRHHREVDSNDDPYAITKGFWYAHMMWILEKEDPRFKGKFAADLAADPLVRWQNKYYFPIAIFSGFILPMLIGAMFGSPMGGLLIGGFLRVFVTQHTTFLINSLCHYAGRQPYSDEVSARNNSLVAIFSLGEGYHNFHHRFQSDYRNGHRWYHWDPTKWFIWTLSSLGTANRLKRVPNNLILRARLEMDRKKVVARGASAESLSALYEKIDQAQKRLRSIHQEYLKMKGDVQESSLRKLAQLKGELRVARLEFKVSCAQWSAYIRSFKRLPQAAS